MFLNGIDMKEALIQWVSAFPNEAAVMLLATLPITELRASVPLGVTVFHLSPIKTLLFSYLGNLIPVVLLFLFLPKVIALLEVHSLTVHTVLKRYFYALETKHKKHYNKYGTVFLILFVAIPLPGSGVWTGSLLAILFNINRKYAIPAILLGMILSGIIVLLLTQGGINLFGLI